jgi:chloramphenicol 3-O-phosphotransferase
MQQNEMDWKWAGILPSHSYLEGTTQIRRFVVRTETSACRRGLDLSQHRGRFVVLGSINGLASVAKSKVAGAFLVTRESCLFSLELDSIAATSPARQVLKAAKLPLAASFC